MNATKKLIRILIALVCMLCAAGIACAGTPEKILINQFEQNADEVTIYLNMMDAAGLSVGGEYAAADFAVTLSGSQEFVPDSASTVENSSASILYALGFDIGKNELASVRDAVKDLVDTKRPQDRVMLAKLGDEVNYVQQPTQDINQLQNAIGQLDQECTSTYTGIRQFMLDVNAARLPNERVVMVLFTDGLDESSGSTDEWPTLQTVLEIRLPVYTIGLRNTSSSERFDYFTRMANYSGTRVFTEADGTATQSMQAVSKLARETVALKLRLAYEYFAQEGTTMWKARYNGGGMALDSNSCSYTLTTAGVSQPTPTPAPATPTPAPQYNENKNDTEKSASDIKGKVQEVLDKVLSLKIGGKSIGELIRVREVQIVLIAAAALLVLVIVIIIITSRSSRRRRMENEPSGSVDHVYRPNNVILVDRLQEISVKNEVPNDVSQIAVEDVEKTYNPYAESEEATMNPYSEEEKTLAPVFDPPVQIRFDVDTREEPPFVKEVSFTDEMMIGRHKDCQLVLAPRYVSRYHLKLTKTDQGVFIYNQKPEETAQYVMLNRVSLGEKEQQIHDGDLLEISRTQVRIHILSDEEGKKD